MAAAWRDKCRACGKQTVNNRAWCQRHLRMVQLDMATDGDDIPTPREGVAYHEGIPPFPYWRLLTP